MDDEYFAILPFRFLDSNGRALARKRLTEQAFARGQAITRRGDTEDQRIFLLLEGTVEATNDAGRVIGTIHPGHYFGERAALFDLPRIFPLRAGTACRVAALPGPVFLKLLRDQPAFAHALGRSLREKQGIFVAFERFLSELRVGATRGHIVIPRLLHLYRPLAPALHHQANGSALDLDALSYALARLPQNIGSTLSLLLTDDVPYLYAGIEHLFHSVPTSARRRTVYEMMPGKSMVVLRDGWSDLVDFVTCLCIYAVEARKLRHAIGSPERLARLRDDPDAVRALDLSEEARMVLRRLIPDLGTGLATLAMHHEDFAVSVLKSMDNYNSAHSERWTEQLAEATRALTGLDPRQLPESFEVHVISSNTHSVDNCLSPWLQEHGEAIDAWGVRECPEIAEQTWSNVMDRRVALLRDYLRAHPELAQQRSLVDRASGVIALDQTALTGIGVQLYDLGALSDRTVDPSLPEISAERTGMILNIDYAFGQQAEAIVASIIALFGDRVRSFNILGKAGGLEGRRGDILVATSFVEQEDDALHVPHSLVDEQRLGRRVPDRLVLTGPVLTVVGTVVQNQVMLNFYRRIWQCIGLEMEGSYYCRQILESQDLGVLRDDVELRFLYYVSDLPLNSGATLAGSLEATEGIPPLYAITREVLTSIFEHGGDR